MTKMHTTNTALDEPLEKRELRQTIIEKEQKLVELIESNEKFKIDLSLIKQEYDVKIGRLYLKLDEADLEILKFKKIENLVNNGLSFEEAQKLVEESLKRRREQIGQEYERLNEEEEAVEKRKQISKEEQEELKKLFHKLAHKFHPDLVGGDDTMMKKINKAYAEGDLETLRAIDQGEHVENQGTETIEELKAKLEKLEELIKKALSEQSQLKGSEWAVLKDSIEKAKKQERDVLSELAEKVKEEIEKKESELDALRKKYEKR